MDSRNDITAGEEATSGGTPLASRRPGLAGVGVHYFLPLDLPVPATAGLGVSALTVVVTREEPPCPANQPASAGAEPGPRKQVSQPQPEPGACPSTYAGAMSPAERTSGSA